MVMLMQIARLQYVTDRIKLDNSCLCLPIRMSHFLCHGNYTEAVCD